MSEDKNNLKEYENFIKDFSNVTNALSLYPPGHQMAENQLKKLFDKIQLILKTDRTISIHQGEKNFIINDKQVLATTQAMDKIIKHFTNFKITDLEILEGITLEELREFLQIICYSEESSKIYPDLKMACEKNQITHIKSLQAAYIRVAKDVKDKLGGKTVGELKISNEEMLRLVSYLKGEIDLSYPEETKIYQKFFANSDLISGLMDKIISEAKGKTSEEKKELLIIVLNQLGKYLTLDSTNDTRKKQNIEIINSLQKTLLKSPAFIALGGDDKLKNIIEQTAERIKLLVKNQALVAEYTKHQKKLAEVKAKIKKVLPQLLEGPVNDEKTEAPEIKKIISEIKKFLEKIKETRTITEADIKKIDYFLEKLEQ